MKETIEQLRIIISEYTPKLRQLDASTLTAKPNPEKWSKKEILGHLVDSAQSNVRRFIVGQYEDAPFIVYNQNKWVSISNYQQYDYSDLVEFWSLLNKHICIVLSNTPESNGELPVKTQDVHTIAWLAADYNKHLLHHLHQVLDLEPIPYP